jgi:CRISPR system Cascade subunit CasA
MSTFNLLDQPWLPVRWASGAPPSEVGLREALVRAHEIEELATDNPLETIALNRLLAALVAAVYPAAAESDDWFRLWQAGQFEATALDDYLRDKQLMDRFDLLSPTHPFMGHPHPETTEVSPLARLRHAATSGNNAVLFSHDLDSQPQPASAAEAARALVCAQAASLGGGVAKPFNFSHGPLVGGAYFWVRGAVGEHASLFRALLLNLAPTPDVWGYSTTDAPTWEASGPVPAEKRLVGGIRELFTFQSRRLALVADEHNLVVGVRYNQGSKVEELLFHDPHLAYRAGKEGVFPLRFQAGKALWRDSTTYLLHRGSAEGGHAPRTLEWVAAHADLLALPRTAALAVDVFGLVNDQAKVELWRQERVSIFPGIITDESRWQALRELLDGKDVKQDDATQRAIRLREATKAFASRARLHKPWGVRLGDVERAERDALVQMLGTEPRYWLAVGELFDDYLVRLATSPLNQLDQVRKEWQRAIRRAAEQALYQALNSLALDARTRQALADAETVLQHGTLYPKFSTSTTSQHEQAIL